MNNKKKSTVVTYGLLLLAGFGSATLPAKLPGAGAIPTPAGEDCLRLTGVVRDFSDSHPDFGVTNPAVMGHYARNVNEFLDSNRLPGFSGAGSAVTKQWLDKNGNPIMPYGVDEPGLAGGHFDVDVYDKVTTSERYHKHQFDDAYDTNFLDVAVNPILLFRSIIPLSYSNNLRLEFKNPSNGGRGSYEFQAGGALIKGKNADGFTTTFNPKLLTKLKVSFLSLADMAGTKPGDSQGDQVNRDGAFNIRMYDAVTNVLKYEIAIYHHISSKTSTTPSIPTPPLTYDNCGAANTDTIGTFGATGTGAVTNMNDFSNWFADKLGTNLSTRHDITLTKNAQGVYEYNTNNFFPIDGGLLGNEGQAHNNLFTYSISTSFTYKKCTGQFFEFQGSDDAWVFINGQLVMDIGGVNTPSRQYIALDRLPLVDGQEFSLDFFYANRRVTTDSLFHMRTNLGLSCLATPPVVSRGYD